MALAWLLTRDGVTGPIIGPRTPEQLDSAIGCLDVQLDDATLTKVNDIFPGYQTSPEDHAW